MLALQCLPPPPAHLPVMEHRETESLSLCVCMQLLPWTQECSSSAHAQTPTFTAVYQLSGWIKAWFILFDYPDYSVIQHGSGTKVSR